MIKKVSNLLSLIFKNEIIRYLLSAGSSFLIDLILFTIFNYLLNPVFNTYAIFISTFLARVLSSLYNYFINSRFVFLKYSKKSIYKYYLLVIIQMMISSLLVYVFSNFIFIHTTILKGIVDIIIFIINYIIQKKIIFK